MPADSQEALFALVKAAEGILNRDPEEAKEERYQFLLDLMIEVNYKTAVDEFKEAYLKLATEKDTLRSDLMDGTTPSDEDFAAAAQQYIDTRMPVYEKEARRMADKPQKQGGWSTSAVIPFMVGKE